MHNQNSYLIKKESLHDDMDDTTQNMYFFKKRLKIVARSKLVRVIANNHCLAVDRAYKN